jgi:hypothetical protein
MTYTPATGYFGSDVLTILSNDLGNTGYGGAQTDTDTVGITVEAKFEVTYLDLWQSTDQIVWDQIPGSYNQGFELELDPAFEYYYLDTQTITTNRALADGYYAFYINSYPDGFFDYWANKNVYEGCTGTWEPAMWGIINGDIPIFHLKVTGSEYILVDGLLYFISGTDDLLRINGDYHLGSYTFTGELTDVLGYTDEVTVPITFYWYPYHEFIPMILQ